MQDNTITIKQNYKVNATTETVKLPESAKLPGKATTQQKAHQQTNQTPNQPKQVTSKQIHKTKQQNICSQQ